jgi:hypothetical protein
VRDLLLSQQGGEGGQLLGDAVAPAPVAGALGVWWLCFRNVDGGSFSLL